MKCKLNSSFCQLEMLKLSKKSSPPPKKKNEITQKSQKMLKLLLF